MYGAIRLANGNTMIAGGNNNRVLEVTPKGKIVWSIVPLIRFTIGLPVMDGLRWHSISHGMPPLSSTITSFIFTK